MDRAHEVENVALVGTMLKLRVDGRDYEIDLREISRRLCLATDEQRARFEVSPSGYGIHWPKVDEDLSIDGLLRIA